MKRTGLTLTLIASLLAGSASADQATDYAIKARQSVMALYAFNLGALGAMAKGTMPYDSAKASAIAGDLVSLSTLDQSAMWPQGSDLSSSSNTEAKPEIWTMYPDVVTKSKALVDALAAMNSAAGTDLASLQGAIGQVGGACGACHKAYRQEK